MKQAQERFLLANPEYFKKYGNKHWEKYADKYLFGGMRKLVLQRDSYKCVKCGMENIKHIEVWNRSITIDHIDGNGRYSKVKNNKLNNLQTLCLPCHGKKDQRRNKK